MKYLCGYFIFFIITLTGSEQAEECEFVKETENLFWLAIAKNNPVAIKHFIYNDVDIQIKNDLNQTLMHAAASGMTRHCPSIIAYLYFKGIDHTSRDIFQETVFDPLRRIRTSTSDYHRENKKDALDALRILTYLSDAPNDVKDEMEFFEYENLPVVQHLINRGIDINAQNHGNQTIMHAAAIGGKKYCPALMAFLYFKELHPLAQDIFGKTVFDYLKSNNTSHREDALIMLRTLTYLFGTPNDLADEESYRLWSLSFVK